MKKDVTIRRGKHSDARAIAEIYAYTWQSAYKDILPKDVLDEKVNGIDEHAHSLSERQTLEKYILAEVGGKVVGVLTCGPSRNEKYSNCGEIISIYVLANYQGMGIGKKLFLAGIENLISLGYNEMILDVLKENEKAIGFYKRMGGVIVDERSELFGSQNIPISQFILKYDNLKKIYENNLEKGRYD